MFVISGSYILLAKNDPKPVPSHSPRNINNAACVVLRCLLLYVPASRLPGRLSGCLLMLTTSSGCRIATSVVMDGYGSFVVMPTPVSHEASEPTAHPLLLLPKSCLFACKLKNSCAIPSF